jgi:Threonine dehydrogenase and related Zn-dependent dehydrogenases
MDLENRIKNRIAQVSEPYSINFISEDIQRIEDDEILLAVQASFICGSDLHIYKGLHPAVNLPVTVGHEFTGKVIAVGDGITKCKTGDLVVVEPVVTCGVCSACRRGEYGYCKEISYTYRQGHGALARYFIAKEEKTYVLPPGIDAEKAALAEPLAVAVHAVKRAQVRLGDYVVIAGAGAIGIMIAMVCKKMGAKCVVISDVSEDRLEMAKQLGADAAVNVLHRNIVDEIEILSSGEGFDKAFECVGKGVTFGQLMSCLKMNGLLTDVGIFEEPLIQMDASIIVKKELRIQGSQGYCWDFEDALQLLLELPFEKLITHRFPLCEVKQAMETALDPESRAIKVCLIPDWDQGTGGKENGRF